MKISIHFLAVLLLLSFVTDTQKPNVTNQKPFSIAILGDMPYIRNDSQQMVIYPQYLRVLNSINAQPVRYTVHLGDMTAQGFCTDSIFTDRAKSFELLKHPIVTLFGDNDWTDCPDPMQSLEMMRKKMLVYPKTWPTNNLKRQQEFPENVSWHDGVISFMGLHVVGSDNNFKNQPEFLKRNEATIAWMNQVFTEAKQRKSKGVVIFMQANPGPRSTTFIGRNEAGFKKLLEELVNFAVGYNGQIALVHGDTHYFRTDMPFAIKGKVIQNIVRAESFGDPNHHWLKMNIHPDSKRLFTFEPMLIPENQ